MSELVKIKGTENVGCVDCYEGDGVYIVTLENGSQGWYKEEELDFLNFGPYPNPDYAVIKQLVLELNNTKQFECMDLDNEEFISYICNTSGLTPHAYREIMKEYLCEKDNVQIIMERFTKAAQNQEDEYDVFLELGEKGITLADFVNTPYLEVATEFSRTHAWEKNVSLDPGIVYEDSHHSDECKETTYFFIAPKEFLGGRYPEAEHAEISVTISDDALDASYASVEYSPSKNGEDYDWYEVNVPYREIVELLKLAKSTLFPDTSITNEEMHRYGYTWDHMRPLCPEKALELFNAGCEIYILYNNDAEGLIEDAERIQTEGENGAIFGIEEWEWSRRRPQIKENK